MQLDIGFQCAKCAAPVSIPIDTSRLGKEPLELRHDADGHVSGTLGLQYVFADGVAPVQPKARGGGLSRKAPKTRASPKKMATPWWTLKK